MAEPDDQGTEPEVEPAAEAAEAPASSTPPPWGDDFNPERAWQTITHQRDRERELEPKAKQLERLLAGEDREALNEILDAYGLELPDEDVPDDEDADPVTAKLSEFEAWKEQQEAKERDRELRTEWGGFTEYVKGLASEQEYDLDDADLEFLAVKCANKDGFPVEPEKAKAEFDKLVAREQKRQEAFLARYSGSKKAPKVPPSGGVATDAPDLTDEKARHAWLRERAQALENA